MDNALILSILKVTIARWLGRYKSLYFFNINYNSIFSFNKTFFRMKQTTSFSLWVKVPLSMQVLLVVLTACVTLFSYGCHKDNLLPTQFSAWAILKDNFQAKKNSKNLLDKKRA